MIDDAQLIDDCLGGNSASFGQLVRKYQDRLFNAVLHVVGCREMAADVVQDAFVLAYTKLSSFHKQSAFYTWLYRIAFNTAMTHRRRRREESSVDVARELSGREPIDAGDTPAERLEREEQSAQVHAALATLTAEHRAILVLREMEGCCYETIAEVLNLPVGTVRSRLHRARMQLKDQLRGVIHEPLAE